MRCNRDDFNGSAQKATNEAKKGKRWAGIGVQRDDVRRPALTLMVERGDPIGDGRDVSKDRNLPNLELLTKQELLGSSRKNRNENVVPVSKGGVSSGGKMQS